MNYTEQASLILDDVLKRPNTWMGIPNEPEKRKEQELTKMQANVDGITKSLIKFSHGEQFDFSKESLSTDQKIILKNNLNYFNNS